MTKVDIYNGIGILDSVSAEGRKHEVSAEASDAYYDCKIRLILNDKTFHVDKSLQLSGYDKDDESYTSSRNIDAVSGNWSVYQFGETNDFILMSDTFDLENLKTGWQRIDMDTKDADYNSDMLGDEMLIRGTNEIQLRRPDYRKPNRTKDVYLHPHYNEQGQVDALVMDVTRNYEFKYGLFNYLVTPYVYDDKFDTYHECYSPKAGGLYELTADKFELYIPNDDDVHLMVEDIHTGHLAIYKQNQSSEEFVSQFLEETQKHEKSDDYKFYMVPNHTNKKYTHVVVLYNNSQDIEPIGELRNDGSLKFHSYLDCGEIFSEWENRVEVGSVPHNIYTTVSNYYDSIADNIAKVVVNGEKPYSQPVYFTMEYVNSKGQVRDNWVTVNKLTSEEAVVEYAEAMIEKWRNGNKDSKVKLLTIETDVGGDPMYKIENGQAYNMSAKTLVDNTTLSFDDLSDLDIDEQSK